MMLDDRDMPEHGQSEPPPVPLPESPRRCRSCFYVIEHLGEDGQCPECGLDFDLRLPFTYTTKPPYVWWTLWLPGFLTAFVSGMLLYVALIPLMGFTWSTVLAIPAAVGAILGYRVGRASIFLRCLLVLVLITLLMLGLLTISFVGAFCAVILGVLAAVPIFVGFIVGWGLGSIIRYKLKQSNFSQRVYLPIILLAPVLAAFIEGRHDNIPTVSTSTSIEMNASIDQAWNSIQFYEQVKHRPPLLLRITPTFRPSYTTGKSEEVGDVKVCVYERGRLVKQVTEVVPGKRLAFKVIEQTDIQNRGVHLIDGSFDFEPLEDGRTRVTLTTRYQPLLEPRVAFLPAENLAVHTLHGHVLKGMSEDALRR